MALLLVLLLALPCAAGQLTLAENNRPVATIAIDSSAGPLAKRAAQILQNRIARKTGVTLPIGTGAGARIVIADPQSPGAARWIQAAGLDAPTADSLGEEGFFLRMSGRSLLILAKEGRGLLYGVGKVLRTARYGPGSAVALPPEGIDKPALATRVLYLAIHCDNFYEMRPASEIAPIVEDMALWGVNGISVWLDETQYNDPFDGSADNAGVRQKWEKEKEVLRVAQQLGLRPGYVLCPNDLYRDQQRPDIVSTGTDSWNSAKLACPSTPGGKAMILTNKTNLFRDLAQGGVQLSSALIFPYDTGGCFCDRCKPWIRTFLNLTEDLAGVVHRFHPNARVYFTDWHCKDDEARTIIDFMNQRKPGWLAGIWKDDRHAVGRFAEVDRSYQTLTFMDITEIGGWGTAGANPFPKRFGKILNEFQSSGIGGYMAYSEGIYDDFNKAATAQLAWNPQTPLTELTAEYANYFFDAAIADSFHTMTGQMEASWSNTLSAWWDVKFIQFPGDAVQLDQTKRNSEMKLPPAVRDSWRWQVFSRRVEIGRLAAALRDDAGFARGIETALDGGGSIDRSRARVQEKQNLLGQYLRAVADLRNSVYLEPATRFPPMDPREKFMTGQLQVSVAAWEKTLLNLRKRLEGGK